MSAIGERIEAVIAAGLSPYLKKLGFVKRGHNFYRSDGDGIQVVTIQLSRRNYGDSGKFRVNFGIHFPEVAKVLHGTDMMPKVPSERYCVLRAIGTIPDRWWTVDSGTDIGMLTSSLNAYWFEIVQPWFEANKHLKEAVKTLIEWNPIAAAAACLTLGKRDEAIQLVTKFISGYEKTLHEHAKDSVSAEVIQAQIKSIREWAGEQGLL